MSGESLPGNTGERRRRHSRYRYSSPVSVRVLVQEETFVPYHFDGRSRNIAAGGMLIELGDLAEERYRTLARDQRMVWVQMDLPESAGTMRLCGKAVRYTYRRDEGRGMAQAAIAFDIWREEEVGFLVALLCRLREKARVTDPSTVDVPGCTSGLSS